MPRRFGKFVFVGCVGTVVQLTALTLLTKLLHLALVPATIASVEAAIIQNFLWHEYYTWPDQNAARLGERLIRFHMANGLISLVGNALITKCLVTHFRFPNLAAALAAIAICGLANFVLADWWVFARTDLKEIGVAADRATTVKTRSVGAATSLPNCP